MARGDNSEAYLLATLRGMFPELSNLEHYDAPDFQDVAAGIGVEATIAMGNHPDMKQRDSLANRFMDKAVSKSTLKKMEDLDMSPAFHTGRLFMCSEGAYWKDEAYEEIGLAVARKTEKLQGGNYVGFPDMRLVIKDELGADEPNKVQMAIETALDGLRGKQFSMIYVVAGDSVFVYDVSRRDIDTHPICWSKSKLFSLSTVCQS